MSHAAQAIAAGKCSVALITLAGRPRSEQFAAFRGGGPEEAFERWTGASTHNGYGMCAMRHMHEFGTTSEQLAWIKVAASRHAQHYPNALLRDVVTVEDVVNSPVIADPLHRLDCCVVTDGGGALLVVSPEIARSPFNTDGGGLCNNHPTHRGGITKWQRPRRSQRRNLSQGGPFRIDNDDSAHGRASDASDRTR